MSRTWVRCLACFSSGWDFYCPSHAFLFRTKLRSCGQRLLGIAQGSFEVKQKVVSAALRLGCRARGCRLGRALCETQQPGAMVDVGSREVLDPTYKGRKPRRPAAELMRSATSALVLPDQSRSPIWRA